MIDWKVFWTLAFFALCCLACYWLFRNRENFTFTAVTDASEKPFIGFQPSSDGDKDKINRSA